LARGGRPLLAGYERITVPKEGLGRTGKPRRPNIVYRMPTGEIISRRQYENRRLAASTGFTSWSEYQRLAAESRYQYMADKAVELRGLSRRQVTGPASEFTELYREAKASGWDKDASGPYAEMLAYVGLRPQSADWDVGQS
jgi:hypothetical protein